MKLDGVKKSLSTIGITIWVVLFIVIVEVCRLNPRWRDEIDMMFGDYYE